MDEIFVSKVSKFASQLVGKTISLHKKLHNALHYVYNALRYIQNTLRYVHNVLQYIEFSSLKTCFNLSVVIYCTMLWEKSIGP